MQGHGRVGRVSLRRLVLLFAIGFAGFLGVAGCAANRMVFHPSTTLDASPAELKHPYEEVFFAARDGTRLNGWFYPATGSTGLVVLVCHGNAGNISHRLPLVGILLNSGASVFAFDYRGYGKSEGKPSEKGVYLDAEGAWEWLRGRGFAETNIVALGESLGGGVACELATRRLLGGLILQSTFTSVPDVAAEMIPWLPMRLLLTTRFNNHEKLKRTRIPVLVLHGRKDTMIRFSHAEKNYAAIPTRSKYFAELNGDHNDAAVSGGEKYQHAVSAFLRTLE